MNIIKRVKYKLRKSFFKDCKTIIIGTGQKVGSTWLFNILRSLDYFNVKNIDYYQHLKIDKNFLKSSKINVYDFLTSEFHATVIKTHSAPPQQWSPDSKVGIVSIQRDPRDVILSTINYLSWLPLSQGGWGEEFASKDLKEKFFIFMKTDWHLSLIENWHFYNKAHKVSYEKMLVDPFNEINDLLSYFEIPFDDKDLISILNDNDFINQKNKANEEKDVYKRNFFSVGKINQWISSYDKDMKDEFKNHQRWNNILIEQGYENTNKW